jgi:quinol monooxygenase YgiN
LAEASRSLHADRSEGRRSIATEPAAVQPPPEGGLMYLINVKFKTKPEWTEKWMDLVHDFTQATRDEPGNLWFEWSRSIDEPDTYVLIEAFTDDGAGPHVNSDHFRKAMVDLKQGLMATPKIVSKQVDGDGWGDMGELQID